MALLELDVVSRGSIFWLICSLFGAALAGYFAFLDAQKVGSTVDLLATIISILIGVSLAVIAVLSTPFSVAEKNAIDGEEASRLTKLIKHDDETFADGQLLLFRIYFAALFLTLVFKWVTAGENTDFSLMHIRLLACFTAAIGILPFCLSARLPLLLQNISKQRRTLGS